MQAARCSSQCRAAAGGPAFSSGRSKPPRARIVISAAYPSREQQCASDDSMAAPAALPRRAALASALAAAAAPWLFSGAALADNEAVKAGLNKYVKKKKLERIDTYVPPLLEARDQLIRVGRVMLQDPSAARELLRSGVFAGMRDNVRSLGEYASQRSGNDSGTQLVRGFFTELEGFDAQLRQAVRGGEGLPEEARTRLDGTIAALDKLLATVPEDAMRQAQQVVAAIREMEAEAAAEEQVIQEKASQLEKLL